MADNGYEEVKITTSEKRTFVDDNNNNNNNNNLHQSHSQPQPQPQPQSQSQPNPIRQHIINAYDATVEDIHSANAAVADHNPRPETPAWIVRCFSMVAFTLVFSWWRIDLYGVFFIGYGHCRIKSSRIS